MSKLIPLNSNEINDIPERYSVDMILHGINYNKATETLLGIHPDSSKKDLLSSIFNQLTTTMPLKKGKVEIDSNLLCFFDAIDINKQEENILDGKKSDKPEFNKKKDLNKKGLGVNI